MSAHKSADLGHGHAPSAADRLGGPHLGDDALQPGIMQALSWLIHHCKDSSLVKVIVDFYRTSGGKWVGTMLPTALNVAIASMAKSSESANLIKDAIVHSAMELNEVAEEKGTLKPEDFEKAIASGYDKALKAQYVRDPERARMFHRPDCPDIAHLLKPKRQQRRGKNGQNQEFTEEPSPLAEVDILTAIKYKMCACPACIPSLSAAVDQDIAAAKAKHAKEGHEHDDHKKSALMILASDPKGEALDMYFVFCAKITHSTDRHRVQRRIAKFLDKGGEVAPLKAIFLLPEQHLAIEHLDLLVNADEHISLFDEVVAHLADDLTPDAGEHHLSPARRVAKQSERRAR